MTPMSSEEILNQILVLHHRSLATYLGDARPWAEFTREEQAQQLLTSIVTDQHRTVDEINELLLERNHTPHFGEFPMSYTGLHDLSFSFLLKKMIEQQQRIIRQIETYVPQLAKDDVARAVAERSLGAAKAHLEMLQQAEQLHSASAA